MQRFLAILLGWAISGGASATAAEPLPFSKPPGLVPRVDFWKRIYTEVDTGGGLIHDSRDLRIVYEVASVPKGLSRRGRDRKLKQRKRHYVEILRTLASGKRTGLSKEQRRVLALFPKEVSNTTLRNASKQVRFQLGQADKFRDGLVRMGRWEGYIRRVLSERGLPTALVALPHVESSFNPAAHSHVGASGIWQFTRSTGRIYMRVDHAVDERRDPFLSTVAAARLLKSNYERTKTWPLAITAYNHGPGGMDRAVRQIGTRDIVPILDRYKSRSFGFASRNFYCEFLAAMEIEENPEPYFGIVAKDPPENPEIALLEHYYPAKSLARTFGVGLEALRAANPALLSPVWSGQKHVPRGYGLRLPRDPLRAAPKVVLASVPASNRFSRQTPDRSYRVKRGDTLSKIARRFGSRESELVALNGLRSRHRIRVGQRLKLPVRGGSSSSRVASRAPKPVPADGVYRVRRGDNVAAISRRFAVSEQDLVAVNRLANRHQIRVGQVLEIPRGASSARPASGNGGKAGVYTVRRGDTLESIAKRFRVSTGSIVALNDLPNRHRIRVGQRLYLPDSGP